MPDDSITIARARVRLTKLITADGTIDDYGQARTFDLFERPLAGLDDLAVLIERLQRCPDLAVAWMIAAASRNGDGKHRAATRPQASRSVTSTSSGRTSPSISMAIQCRDNSRNVGRSPVSGS